MGRPKPPVDSSKRYYCLTSVPERKLLLLFLKHSSIATWQHKERCSRTAA
uniref:Uncharacterized protein n=1 Tax=Utricularia reniformis TaxID=192314 RepID=A0A1Y0B4X9_9LAMI|nr:hypothetical protein AEK19_MT2306 [Utricularia reniformis]ART32449.1 hypothetical protein AEK19_MT2306 [Utricularia reniformis]